VSRTFDGFEEVAHGVVAEPGPQSERSRLHPERSPLRSPRGRESTPQEVVHDMLQGHSRSARFRFQALRDVVFQGQRCPGAHIMMLVVDHLDVKRKMNGTTRCTLPHAGQA